MSTFVIYPSKLQGTVCAPPSKSEAHRIFICAALCRETTIVKIDDVCVDVFDTIECLRSLGASITELSKGLYRVVPVWKNLAKTATLYCRQSGSTLRFLLPVCAALGVSATFTGDYRLAERPIAPIIKLLQENAISVSADTLPLTISGKLRGGNFSIGGDVSSQFVSGLLLAAPIMSPCKIEITGKLQSAPYVSITQDIMAKFGVVAPDFAFTNQEYISPFEISVSGDWSAAAVWLCAGAISGKITVTNLDTKSSQGDRRICEILRDFGANIEVGKGEVTVSAAPLHAIDLDGGDIPDIIMPLCAVACLAEGNTPFLNIERLRIKESDRIVAIHELLFGLGGEAKTTADTITISQQDIEGGVVNCFSDHRLLMTATLFSTIARDIITLEHAQYVAKSYAAFYADFKKLGGKFDVVHDREQD